MLRIGGEHRRRGQAGRRREQAPPHEIDRPEAHQRIEDHEHPHDPESAEREALDFRPAHRQRRQPGPGMQKVAGRQKERLREVGEGAVVGMPGLQGAVQERQDVVEHVVVVKETGRPQGHPEPDSERHGQHQGQEPAVRALRFLAGDRRGIRLHEESS